MSFPKEPIGPVIVSGALYRYLLDMPAGCKGGIYRVERFVLDVPSYQEKILVHCVEGKDKGLWFTCAPWNFALRYERVETEETKSSPPVVVAPVVERVADFSSRGTY